MQIERWIIGVFDVQEKDIFEIRQPKKCNLQSVATSAASRNQFEICCQCGLCRGINVEDGRRVKSTESGREHQWNATTLPSSAPAVHSSVNERAAELRFPASSYPIYDGYPSFPLWIILAEG